MDESNSNKSHFNLQPVDNNLLELVQKNKTIPTFLNTLIPNDPRLRCLKKAIHKGNFRARIWNNRHCNLYLTYLIQEKMIPFWHGITAYVYLIAKMQYTQTQDLRIEDLDVKFNYQVKIVPLVKAGKITELGYQYLLGMIDELEKLQVTLNFDQLANYILKLPRIEQWLINTEFSHHMTSLEARRDANRLVSVLINNLPLVQKLASTCYEDPTTHYLVPSSSIINYCLSTLTRQPMRMRPVFGNPGLATLYRWHTQDYHPVSLYAPQILSNPKEADGYRCGPFPMWLHDIGHTFWASMLSKDQRNYIFMTYIPALRRLKDVAEAYKDDSSIEFFKEADKKAYDFDLTAILDYADVNTRFDIYLAHTMGKNPIYPSCLYNGMYEYEAIGRAKGDAIYFLLHCALYNPNLPEAFKRIYKTLINHITIGKSYRDLRIINALKLLAKNTTSHPEVLFAHDLPGCQVSVLDWQRLLNSSRTSEEFWQEMTGNGDRAEELLDLIEHGLIFFHPYLPLTALKRWVLLNYLEKQQPVYANISKDGCGNVTIKPKFQAKFFSIPENDSSELLSTEAKHYKI